MININNKKIENVTFNEKECKKVFYNNKLVYEKNDYEFELITTSSQLYGRAFYNTTSPTTSVLVSLVFNMKIEKIQYYVDEEEFADDETWNIRTGLVKIDYNGNVSIKEVSIAEKVFYSNTQTSVYGYRIQTIAGRDIISRKVVSIIIKNIV